MTSLHGASLTGLAAVMLVSIATADTVGPTTQAAVEPIAQLRAGKSPGTFHLVYKARAEFSTPGHCALVVQVSAMYQEPVTAAHLDDAGPFTAEADLRPGTYSVAVSPVEEKDPDYWASDRQNVHIDKAGRLYQPRAWFSENGIFVLDRRMKGLAPADEAVATAKQPLLTWPAVAGATHYRGDYHCGDDSNWFNVEETQYKIGRSLEPEWWCSWRVSALNDKGKVLARGAGFFYGQGTDATVITKNRAAGSTCGVPPTPGRPYLGFYPFPTQVPKDPRKPIEYGENGSRTLEDSDRSIPGIEVHQVFPGSPAIDADLHPDDVIIAVDGVPVPSEMNQGDSRTFSQQVSQMQPGTKLTLTVRRFPRELTLNATIGRYPGGAATTEPATQPAPATPTTAPVDWKQIFASRNAPAFHAAWRQAPAGAPATRPFHVEAGAEIPFLSTKDGLADDDIQCMAELPHGGMAFGSREGLSLWDGKEIRTYTGPAFTRGGDKNGNSALPSDDVHDLLCDARGRLWVATSFGVCRIDLAHPDTWSILDDADHRAFAGRWLDESLDVEKLFETSDGTIVLGAHGGAITLIDPKTDAPRMIRGDNEMNHWVSAIAEDKQHQLWFSMTGVGVLRYDGKKVEQIHGDWIVDEHPVGLCIDRDGTIWVAASGAGLGALHADGTVEKVGMDQLAGRYLWRLSLDRSGRLWVACDGGFAVRQPGARTWKFAGSAQSYGAQVLDAGDGSWWTSSPVSRKRRIELSAIKPQAREIEQLKQEIEKAYPNVKADGRTAVAGGIVVGSAGEELLRYDGKTWENLAAKLGHVDVSKIRADSKGNIWIGTSDNGLIGLTPAGQIRRYNNDRESGTSVIYDFDEAPDGTLWVGSQHGVFRLRDNKWERVETDQPLYQVGQVLADHRGRVWFVEVTYDMVFIHDGKRFREIKKQSALSEEKLQWGSLRLDPAGNVLIDVRARPGDGLPQRTFCWMAAAEGKIGEPIEVK